MRQVPRLVFANACFSAVTTNQNEQRGQLVGLAQAFFARGIPNYIGSRVAGRRRVRTRVRTVVLHPRLRASATGERRRSYRHARHRPLSVSRCWKRVAPCSSFGTNPRVGAHTSITGGLPTDCCRCPRA